MLTVFSPTLRKKNAITFYSWCMQHKSFNQYKQNSLFLHSLNLYHLNMLKQFPNVSWIVLYQVHNKRWIFFYNKMEINFVQIAEIQIQNGCKFYIIWYFVPLSYPIDYYLIMGFTTNKRKLLFISPSGASPLFFQFTYYFEYVLKLWWLVSEIIYIWEWV